MKIKKYDLNIINKEAKNSRLKLINKSEDFYHKEINNIVSSISQNGDIKFLLLSGPSSAGKTTTSKLLKAGLRERGINAQILSIDDFFIDRDKAPLLPDGKKDYESVNSIDWKLFDECVSELLNGKVVKLPTYNFKTGKKEYVKPLTILGKNDFIIVEGLHALNPIIDNFIPAKKCYKLYINIASVVNKEGLIIDEQDIRLIRRIIRDVEERGYTPEHTLAQWALVCDGERLYIDPFKDTADFTVATFHPYEICVYAYIFQFLKLEEIENEKLQNLVKFLSKAYKIDPDFVPANSLLQEFIKIKC